MLNGHCESYQHAINSFVLSPQPSLFVVVVLTPQLAAAAAKEAVAASSQRTNSTSRIVYETQNIRQVIKLPASCALGGTGVTAALERGVCGCGCELMMPTP